MVLGLLCGLLASTVLAFRGHGWQWSVIGKWIVVFVLVAAGIELLWKFVNK
jgi:hypothetical protein